MPSLEVIFRIATAMNTHPIEIVKDIDDAWRLTGSDETEIDG